MTDLTLIGPLFLTETTETTQAKYSQGKLSTKTPFIFLLFNVTYETGRVYRAPLSISFRHFATLIETFFDVSKGSPFKFFDILQPNVC